MSQVTPDEPLDPAPSVAVIFPCRNESAAITPTIEAFRAALPDARIIVCDNASTDDTVEVARAAGAEVLHQPFPGKGNAVRRLLSEIDADVYVMADGDATYDAPSAPAMVRTLLDERLDMVIGRRIGADAGQYPAGHEFANKAYSWLFCTLFSTRVEDLLSGYRVMSRRFVKTFPCRARGFEIEPELNAHAAVYRLPVREMSTPYHARAEGSYSKLSKYSDGLRILAFFIVFLRDYAPLRVFGTLGMGMLLVGFAVAVPVLWEYAETGLVERFPTWFASLAIMLGGIVFLTVGFAMESISAARYQSFMGSYLGFGEHRRHGGP